MSKRWLILVFPVFTLLGFCIYLVVARPTSTPGKHSEVQRGCFLHHFRTAIDTYRVRQLQYATVSNGRSDSIFKKVLFNQYLAAPLAWVFDQWAEKYQEQGIPILCLDFVEMTLAPSFLEKEVEPWPKDGEFYTPNIMELKKEFKFALDAHDFTKVNESSHREYKNLEKQTKLNCMYRHFIESLARMSHLAPTYIEKALQKNLDSPVTLIKWTMETHVLFFDKAFDLDREALPLQIAGLPILCRDVPRIEMSP